MKKNKVIIILGPTASGKTSLAVKLSKKYNGEIISADSRQVFRGLNIGTGKDLKEYGDIKYHLIDIVELEEKFTMFDWLKLAREVIDNIISRGKLPIVVGGTGLYIQALTQGFELEKSQISNLKSQIYTLKLKKYSREELEKISPFELQKIYLKLSNQASEAPALWARSRLTGGSEANKLDIKNPHRLIRAIERTQSGQKMTKKKPKYQFLQIGISCPREELIKRIDKRVDDRFEHEGMLEEVQGLIDAGVDTGWLIKLGLEYRIIGRYVLENPKSKIQNPNKIPKSKKPEAESLKLFLDMRQELKTKIHQFAKRQMTWFKRFLEIKWVNNQKEAEILLTKYL